MPSRSSSWAPRLSAANFYFKRDKGLTVTTEVVKMRDLEAIVSASGKIQPKRLVNISAETPGRVVDLAVNEGDRIKKGQFLLQIDPNRCAAGSTATSPRWSRPKGRSLQLRQSVETARVQVDQAQQNLTRQRNLWSQQLTTREALEKAENDLKTAQSALQEREKQVGAQSSRISQERAALESSRYDLTKVRMESPIDGIVTRRNIQQGETAVIGTMNNAGTVLLQLADMSVIQAEVEVDETNIPHVQIGQRGEDHDRRDPRPLLQGPRHRDREQPDSGRARHDHDTQATNFKVVVVLDEPVPEVRPGFTATADITTATSERKSSRCRFRRWPCVSSSTTRTGRS